MKLKRKIIGVIAASALVLSPAFAQNAQQNTNAAIDTNVVQQIQQTLNNKGYNVGAVDGKMGKKTQQALTKFQQAQGLQATGQIDQQTLAALGVQAQEAVGGGQMGGSGTGGAETGGGAMGGTGSSSDQPGAGAGSSGSGGTGSTGTGSDTIGNPAGGADSNSSGSSGSGGKY